MRKYISILFTVLAAGATLAFADSVNSYVQTNLVSDLPGIAAHQDPDLVNPWGIVAGPTTPIWVNENGTGLSTIFVGDGTKPGLVVTIPPPAGGSPPSAPTGIVFNSSSNFGGAHFLFATEDGTIAAFTGSATATLPATGASGSVYKGLALAGNLLYATNFTLGRVDVFDSNFNPTTVSGGFTDNTLPAGYAPFGIQAINGDLYVTYALRSGKDDVPGAGHGFIDVFDTNGNLVKRLVSDDALNSPWALAPVKTQFGAFAPGDLLVGNFGDGMIHAYDSNGNLIGALKDVNGSPVAIDGLWGLTFGNDAHGQSSSDLFFAAGIAGPDNTEDHGLFGTLSAGTPEPQPALLVGGTGFAALLFLAFRRRLARNQKHSVPE